MHIPEFRGPNRIGGKTLRKTGSAGDSGFAEHLEAKEGAAEAPVLGGVGALEGALLLQEAGDGPDARQEARQHGSRLLEHLDRLRMDLLLGEISAGQLARLQQVLERERPEIVPPEMRDVLGEIELRVRVEIAKFEQR